MVFYRFLALIGFTKYETKLAAFLGRLYRDYILRNRRLTGKVGDIFLTRGKIQGISKNLLYDGFVSEDKVRSDASDDEIVYSVIYQAWLYGDDGNRYLLSLNTDRLWMIGKHVRIDEYWVILHPGHRFVIGSDVEIYPGTVGIWR